MVLLRYLREMEREAYEVGNLIFRDWEDKLKDKGARPLFTSTHYANAIMEKGENLMEKQLVESHLRNIIRGVIQEMFNDDLNEDASEESMVAGGSAASMRGRSMEQAAEEEGVDKPARAFGISGLEESDGIEEEKENLEEESTQKEVKESFFPKERSVREKARFELNEALTKRWAKVIK